MKIKVKKGDNVQVLSGKDRGKTGTITRVLIKDLKVVVEGVNVVKKHVRPRRSMPHGGIVATPASMSIAKVMAICPRCSKPTRIAITTDSDGKRHRTCKKCHEVWAK